MPTFSLSSRSIFFWIFFVALSISGIIFSYRFFSKAFAIVQLNISMDRNDALKAAKERSLSEKIGPENYSQAAIFQTDSETKNFIELEGGGVSALEDILAEQWYTPYFWQVRHFKQYNPHEALFYFTPSGKPYGFQEKLSQYQEGPAIAQKQARAIAEQTALKYWHISFDSYQLAETANNTALSGRVDHTFIYERTDKKIDQAPYRLKLVVGGDRLTELSYSIKVPEAFKRRYENMRSTNHLIAFIATFLMGLLYLGIGIIAGLIFLLHRHLLWWRPALLAALFIALMQVLNSINELPLEWMDYETALSTTSFLLKILTSIIAQFIIYAILLTMIFSVAEGLTRAAFPNHLRLWNSLTDRATSTIQLIGRIIGGYLIIGFDLAFVIGIYTFARTYFGWWNPSETLVDPNILSTYLPWFSSISRSLMAGMMEESLFRAIPLAGAALIARRIGYRTPIMIFAFILQAFIFGAAHANYPAQPAYARLLELIIPSFVFGGIYLAYGLIPAMLSHVVFDIFWFALPLFLATGLFFNKTLVVLISLLPIWLIIRGFIKNKKVIEAPAGMYNYSWVPLEKKESTDHHIDTESYESPTAASLVKLASGAILGSILWITFGRFSQDNRSIDITKKEAVAKSFDLAQQNNLQINQSPWQPLPSVDARLQDEHRFVWQTATKKTFAELLGSYLPPAVWSIRFVQFEGDLEQRAKEYEFYIDSTGRLVRLKRELPESQPGASLSQQAARQLAHNHLRTTIHVDPNALVELSAESIKQPARTDWHFTFKDPSIKLPQGEARIKMTLHGDQLGDYERLVFIPEEWERAYKEHKTYESILSMICRFILIGALIAFGLILGRRWKYMHISVRVFIGISLLIGIKAFLNSFNIWPIVQSGFVTSQPFLNQMLTVIGWYILMVCVQAISLGAGASLATAIARKPHKSLSLTLSIFIAGCCSIILVAARSLLDSLLTQPKPFFADFSSFGSHFPAFGLAASILTTFVTTTIVLIIMARAIDYFVGKRKYQTLLTVLWFIILYGAYNGLEIDGIVLWITNSICIGIILGLLYKRFIQPHYELWPWISYFAASFFAIQQITFNAYPGAIAGSIGAIILMGCVAYWWSNELK